MRSDQSRRIFQSALLSVSLAACGGGGHVPDPVPPSVPAPSITTVGTDFYLTLPDHLCVSDPASCNNLPVSNKLILAAAAATTGEVTFNGAITPFSVAAGAETVITLDPAVVLTSNETVEPKGIHITAQLPVSVHVVSENATSADGYLALPTPGLGTRYYVMSRSSIRYSGSEFAVVATQDNTTVSITPSAAGATKPAGNLFTVLLNSGETYQLANPANADMTGTLVTSDKPVAVFSGHRCADVPTGVNYCDYLVEQLPDVSAWGKTFHTSPFSGRARYTVRVIASHDGTTFTTIPAGLINGTLNAGQYTDAVLTGAVEIVSSNPVLTAQFMHGYSDDASAKGDPSMVLVTPAEMGVSDATFGVHGLAGTQGAYMNIVTETASLANLKLDNMVVNPALFAQLGGTSTYSSGTIQVAPGVHTLSGTTTFTALVYDYGIAWDAVSYAYPVAAALSMSSPPPPVNPGCGSDHQDDDRNPDDALEQSRQTRPHQGSENEDGHECHK
ncbi:MAG TPA: IgGFc-binding protein [Gallionella sp.]|nr:IgGFc-binding protein [Gallionella sp.]